MNVFEAIWSLSDKDRCNLLIRFDLVTQEQAATENHIRMVRPALVAVHEHGLSDEFTAALQKLAA